MEILTATPSHISQAALEIANGNLVGVPTETVYGLAADATNDLAVAKIYQTKGRPQFNPLIVHVYSIEQAETLVYFNDLARKLANAFWPGALTFVLPRKSDAAVSYLASAGLDTLAIRFPSHPVMQALIRAADCPIAAPSANPSNKISPTKASHVYEGFKGKDQPQLILDGGDCSIGLESTVVLVMEDHVILLRPGGISIEDLQRVCPVILEKEQTTIQSPGMLEKHYAPEHPLRLDATDLEEGEVLLAFGDTNVSLATLNLSPSGDLVEAAANLFAMLHELDKRNCKGIAVMPIPHEGLGIAIRDRLQRASTSLIIRK